jgi:hypothetical protein
VGPKSGPDTTAKINISTPAGNWTLDIHTCMCTAEADLNKSSLHHICARIQKFLLLLTPENSLTLNKKKTYLYHLCLSLSVAVAVDIFTQDAIKLCSLIHSNIFHSAHWWQKKWTHLTYLVLTWNGRHHVTLYMGKHCSQLEKWTGWVPCHLAVML